MHYLGGKDKISSRIADFLIESKPVNFSGNFYDCFCGSGAITYALLKKGFDCHYFASDVHPDLIAMFHAIQEGWTPDFIDEQKYNFLKKQPVSAERGFAGFCLSFGGKWFGGFARCKRGDDYFQAGLNSIQRRLPYTKKIDFSLSSYEELIIPKGSLVYCDPPYAKTTGYQQGKFDHEKFYNWARDLSKHCVVLISEYEAPDDFECVFEIERRLGLRSKNGSEFRMERIFSFKL